MGKIGVLIAGLLLGLALVWPPRPAAAGEPLAIRPALRADRRDAKPVRVRGVRVEEFMRPNQNSDPILLGGIGVAIAGLFGIMLYYEKRQKSQN